MNETTRKMLASIKAKNANADPDAPDFPAPRTDGPSHAELLKRDAASPWHREWDGKTSVQAREEVVAKVKGVIEWAEPAKKP